MLAILPLISFFLLFLLFQKPQQDWRNSYLASAVVLGSLIALSSEVLSLIRGIDVVSISLFWSMVVVLLGWRYSLLVKQGKRSFPLFGLPKLTLLSGLVLGGILSIVILVGVVALIAPPNNWDSMTYHMARVMHWIQNHNLAHYPTYYAAQLVHPPWAELAIMHLQILSGGDRWANLVQWFCMTSSIIGVSAIAQQLGAKWQGQLFAAVFCASIPMGILQGSSTQNDYAVAFWLVCLAHYTLMLVSSSKISGAVVLAVASSFGLALLTKNTAYFFSFPFIVWLSLWLWNAKGWKGWQPLSTILLIAFLFNAGHYLRNLELFGSPISASDYKDDYQVKVYNLPNLISTIIRNLAFHSDIVRYLHLQKWITPITGIVEKIVYLIHQTILKVSPSDPNITLPGYTYRVPGVSFNEDVAVAPLHLIVILLAILLFLIFKRFKERRTNLIYLLSLIGGFLLFSLMLKIQPYHPRHHLILFVLFAPFVGLVYSAILSLKQVKIFALVFIITCLPWLFKNSFRSLVGEKSILNMSRNDIYFVQRKHLKQTYNETANLIGKQDCSDIGLSLGWDVKLAGSVWEYPFWVLIASANPNKSYRFSHIVSPENPSASLMDKAPYNQFPYCAIVAIRSDKDRQAEQLTIGDKLFVRRWSSAPASILLPADSTIKLP